SSALLSDSLVLDDDLHIHVVVPTATLDGALSQILSWRWRSDYCEVFGAFSQAEIPALIPQLVNDEAVYIVLSGFLDSVGVCMDENLLQSGYIIC
ncbi:MAG: hypothetical protein QOI94_2878, partial [Acidobacteriaceae bacterium]|nr:hypothetical protein [Acidobacteriaceae bacterium]